MAKILGDGLTIKLTEDEEKKVIAQVTKDIDDALGERSEEESDWLIWEDEQYLGDLGAKNSPWENCSNVNSSMTMEAVNDTWSRLVNTTFPFRPYVRIKGRGDKDKENAELVEDYWDYLSQEMPLMPLASLWFLDAVKLGTGVVVIPWEEKKCRTRKGEGGKIKEETAVTYQGPKIEPLNLKDFIIPKSSKGVQYPDSRFACRKYRLYLDQIKRKEKEDIFINVKEFVEKIEKGEKGKEGEPNKQYELYEYWGRFDADDDGLEENVVFTILKDEEVLLRATIFPYYHNKRPFSLITFIPKRGSIYGLGLCEMLRHIHQTETTIFNQMIDNASLVNNKMFQRRKGARIDRKGLSPGAEIVVEEINKDIAVFELGDLHISSFELLNVCRMYFERISKVTDFTSGRRSSTRKGQTTATEVMSLIAESNKWFDLILKHFLNGYVEVLEQGTALLQQYLPEEGIEFAKRVVEDTEKIPFKTKIKKEQIAGNFDYIPQAKTVISQELEERKALAFFDIAMKLPFIQEQPELMKELAQDLFTTLGKSEIAKRLDKYLPTTPEQLEEAMKDLEEKKKAVEKVAGKMAPKAPQQQPQQQPVPLPQPPMGGIPLM